MKFIRGQHNLSVDHEGCVATIGNFDGIHRGHQRVIEQVNEKAHKLNLPSVLITFEPQPREFFTPDSVPARLTRLREKLDVLRTLSIDEVLCLRFCKALAELTAEQFVQEILVDGLNVRYLVVGDDFRFGKNRTGDYHFLQSAGKALGFDVSNTHSCIYNGSRISSTVIRESLRNGDLETAKIMLGRDYSMCGRVAHGDKRGRTIGFPTANIYLHRITSPVSGVYAVELHSDDPRLQAGSLFGVANVGQRPTVEGTRTLLEVHLFDFNHDIYGARVQVKFIHKIREEQRFDSIEALKAQINVDAQQAKALFRLNSARR
jgi:riboflavin kinase / FMN adenylyltransferase